MGKVVAARAAVLPWRPRVAERAVASAAGAAGSTAFLKFNFAWIGAWVVANLELLPGLAPFDPFTFRILMILLPSEALALVALTAANRARLRRMADRMKG